MNDAAETPNGRSASVWLVSHWFMIALVVAATLLANGALIFADSFATTCSDYVPKVSNARIDVLAGFHKCHHFVGLEIPIQWNPVLAFGFGLLAGGLTSMVESHEPPPKAAGPVIPS